MNSPSPNWSAVGAGEDKPAPRRFPKALSRKPQAKQQGEKPTLEAAWKFCTADG